MAMRIAVVGDTSTGRERVLSLLRAAPSEYVVGSKSDADVVIAVVAGRPAASVPGVCALAAGRPMIVVDDVDRPEVDGAAMRAGAFGYVTLDGVTPAVLDKWIRYTSQPGRNGAVAGGDLAILLALAGGASAAEAARAAGVSVRTVYRRRAHPAFRASVDRLRTQIIAGAAAISAERLATHRPPDT